MTAPGIVHRYDGRMTAKPTQPRFLTLAQVAAELNAKPSLVQGLIRTGELRAFQIGGRGYLACFLRLMRIVS